MSSLQDERHATPDRSKRDRRKMRQSRRFPLINQKIHIS
jgi:hypothetical protein